VGASIVPRRSPDTVSTAPLPGVRSPVNVPRLGGGGVDITPVANEVSELIQRHQQHADQVILLDADNKLAQLETDVRTAATQKRGKDALGATQYASDAWAKGVSDLESGLTTDKQREVFRARAASRYESLYANTEAHAADEWNRFEAQTTDDAVTNRMSAAVANYRDPEIVAKNAVEARAIIQDAAKRFGWSDETRDQKVASTLSAMHSGIINRFLAVGDDRAAQAYYDKARSQLTGDDLVRIDKSLDESSTRGQSQREADRIMGVSQTLAQGLAEAAKITDPKTREATEHRVRQAFEDKAAGDREERFKAYQDAGVTLEKTHSTDKIPPATWNLLSVTERRSLQEREDQLRHPRHTTNMDTWYKLMNMAGLNDSTRAEFESTDLNKYRRSGELDEQDFEHMAELQLTMRRQTAAGISGEARREATAADRDAKKAADRAAAAEELRKLGISVAPAPAPGGPIVRPVPTGGSNALGGMVTAPTPAAPAPAGKVDTVGGRVRVPQSWIDHAKRDQNYRLYLEHMGVKIP
jgi:hypothetical protein